MSAHESSHLESSSVGLKNASGLSLFYSSLSTLISVEHLWGGLCCKLLNIHVMCDSSKAICYRPMPSSLQKPNLLKPVRLQTCACLHGRKTH